MALFCCFYDWVVFHCIYVPHLLHPFIDGWLGCFCVLAILSSAAVNMELGLSFSLEFCLDICSGEASLDRMVILFSVSWGTSILFSIVAIPNYIPTNSVGGFPFLHFLSSSVRFSSVAQSCPTLCDPTDCSMPGFPVLHQLLELTQTHVHQSVIPSNHLILCCCPLLLPPSVFLSISVFSSESVLLIRWSKYWSFSFSISPSNEYSEQISFRMDWLDLLAVQGTLKSLLHHHISRASILRPSAFFIVQLSHPYMTNWKNHVLASIYL